MASVESGFISVGVCEGCLVLTWCGCDGNYSKVVLSVEEGQELVQGLVAGLRRLKTGAKITGS
jgi:hypothetical protein